MAALTGAVPFNWVDLLRDGISIIMPVDVTELCVCVPADAVAAPPGHYFQSQRFEGTILIGVD